MKEKLRKIRLVVIENRRSIELVLFSVAMWGVVVCCFVGLAMKVFVRPSSVPVHYLLGAILLAGSLALLLPTILSRIGEISFAGVKVVLAQTETVLDDLQTAFDDPNGELDSDEQGLKDPQQYDYERLSLKLYRVFDQIRDPHSLDFESRRKYRRLIDYVGRAAFAMGHQTKYLQIVLHFQSFSDREMTWDEEFLIGHAYLSAADLQSSNAKRNTYWQQSAAFLEAARHKNTSEARIPFHWGMAMLCLANYPKGIELLQASIDMSDSMAARAKWNIACGLKKLGKNQDALDKLDEILPGTVWEANQEDDWFKDPGNPDFERQFKTLCQTKIAAYKASIQ